MQRVASAKSGVGIMLVGMSATSFGVLLNEAVTNGSSPILLLCSFIYVLGLLGTFRISGSIEHPMPKTFIGWCCIGIIVPTLIAVLTAATADAFRFIGTYTDLPMPATDIIRWFSVPLFAIGMPLLLLGASIVMLNSALMMVAPFLRQSETVR